MFREGGETVQAETRYARSGDVSIAYQVTGAGPFDLVFVPGYVTHLELQWSLRSLAPLLERQGSFCRLIRFDKRGTGMSDRVTGAPTLETRMDDVRAVMDAVGSRRAALFGLSEGASMSILFAATYPERTAALVLRSAFPRTMWAPDYPWGSTEEQFREQLDRARRVYGPRAQALEAVQALGRFETDEAEEFLDFQRMGASPGALEALIRMNKDIDVRHVLRAVRVPTLILHGTEDAMVPRDVARYVASRIPGAILHEIPGAGHLAVGETGALILDEMQRFLTDAWEAGGWDDTEPDRVLATVMFADIVDSTTRAVELGDRQWRALLERYYALVRRQLLRFRGQEVDTAGDGFLAAFDGPARAIRCACAIVEGAPALGLHVRAGLHTGECELVDGKVAGIAVHTGARVAAHAAGDEVLVSATVRDLVAGSGMRFDDHGPHELKGIPGRWVLFAVSDAGDHA
jgi:pimeloyl-ACP methyl ester carboxylesterase/class 3 adenylate cyclase